MSPQPPIPGVHCLIVRHDAWCPGAAGHADRCICNAVPEFVTVEQMADAIVQTRNRAQRRADAKRKGAAR